MFSYHSNKENILSHSIDESQFSHRPYARYVCIA